MKMNGRRLVTKAIVHVDNKPIALIHFDNWQGPLAVDPNNFTGMEAVGVGCHPSHIEIISDCFCLNELEAKK